MISSILIPTDFSPASWSATQLGMELSRQNDNAVLSFLHVYPLASRYVHLESLDINDDKLAEVEKRMNHLSSGLLDRPDRIRNVVLSGNVEETMLQFIKEHTFDLIIVGINSNGRNNEIGSHAARLIQESGVPVMIVPNRTSDGDTAS